MSIKYYTSTGNIIYNAGYNLMTEKKQQQGVGKDANFLTNEDWTTRKDLNSDQYYVTKPSGRLGALYVGYGNHYAGFNSDAVRSKIQNDWIHNAVNSPHFINSSYGVLPYGGYWPTKKFSLW